MSQTNKIKNIFDWLNEITYIKSPVSSFTEDDWGVWNNYMIHRFVSQEPKYIEIVNEAQLIPPQSKKELYLFYSSILPKQKKFFKYIKSSVKESSKELVESIALYYKCSTKEAREYVKLLNKTQLEDILSKLGKKPEEIKKLLK